MTHLLAAQLAGRDGRAGDAEAHLAEAADLAAATGERNTLAWHFGPANVAAWSLAIAVERGDGPSHAERLDANPVVAHAQHRALLLARHGDLNRPPLPVFDRVAQQIEEHLSQAAGVAAQPLRAIRRQPANQLASNAAPRTQSRYAR